MSDSDKLLCLYAESGGDVTRCEICDEPLDDTQPWRRGLDGAGAHTDCVRPFLSNRTKERGQP